MPRLDEIQIRDPYVLAEPDEGAYYLFGSTDADIWAGPGKGFDCYRSTDLAVWEGPIEAFRPPEDFWSSTQFWAPECHPYRGRWYLLATFGVPAGDRRGTQVLVADRPEGPYVPWSDGPVTPPEWLCLDGTLHVAEDGQPWMVFCHEWMQCSDGEVCAVRLSEDLHTAVGDPVVLFRGSAAPWARSFGEHAGGPAFVTDGPFLHRTQEGALLMLWSSFGEQGYAMGVAESESGTVVGPWRQRSQPVWGEDGGHGMAFRTFDGRLWLTLHSPNTTPHERATFVPLTDDLHRAD
ncbi:glycoside hydrolase family 43 protein [Blastococcus sp. URHD0036]|uniref:glycoside hydrolase family 43 protein n=1 Tax=Blastococcus sp. URHD0036 TaxID=1380356 RepID=UPI0004967B1F|nr:glycoside hydrolase family 43 protein [Blastococcus sp. URHD0036]